MPDYTKNTDVVNSPSDDDMMLMGDFSPAPSQAAEPLGPENMYYDERVGRNVPVGTPNRQIMDEARRMGRDPFPAAEGLSSVGGEDPAGRGMPSDQFPSPEGLSSVGRVEPMSGRISADRLIGARPAGPAIKPRPLGPSQTATDYQKEFRSKLNQRYPERDGMITQESGIYIPPVSSKKREVVRSMMDSMDRLRAQFMEDGTLDDLELLELQGEMRKIMKFDDETPEFDYSKPGSIPPEEMRQILTLQRLTQQVEDRRSRLKELRRAREAVNLETRPDMNQLTDEELRMQRMIYGTREQ
tara:strand:- start:3412 stop:4308 length:897 start_codon:yes stop_codon:yes gene_type:complete